jgi:hypothetical protein
MQMKLYALDLEVEAFMRGNKNNLSVFNVERPLKGYVEIIVDLKEYKLMSNSSTNELFLEERNKPGYRPA